MICKARFTALAAMMAACFVSTSSGQSVDFFLSELGEPIPWPTTGEIITGTPQAGSPDIFDVFSSGERAGQLPHTLTQTFQVDAEFDFTSLFITYRNDVTSFNQRLEIFAVDDVFATTLPDVVPVEDVLFSQPFDALSTVNERQVAQLVLDSPLTLLPNTAGPNAGYAVRFRGDTTSGGDRFRWHRTGSTLNTTLFPSGQAFENGNARSLSSGGRTFGLVLSDAPAPPDFMDAFSVQSGSADVGSTWSTGAPPEGAFIYNIVSGDTVSFDSSSFAGGGVVVESGGTLDLNANGVNFQSLELQAGSTLDASSTPGSSIVLGTISDLFAFQLDTDVTFTPGVGGDVNLFARIAGSGDINVESNGPGSDLGLVAASNLDGVVRFNGSGDRVLIVENNGFNTLELNSTGRNSVLYQPQAQTGSGTLIFNQPGMIEHFSPAQRRQSVNQLVANADVEVDLRTPATGNSLRFQVGSDLTGTGDIDIVGTPSAPAMVDANQFEIGTRGDTGSIQSSDYGGTITTSQFVELEVHRSLPNASIVVQANSQFEAGYDSPTAMTSISVGSVSIQNGGTLVVGFAEGESHNPHALQITSSGARDGSLTTAAGSTVVMQINGTGDGEFDSITASGDVSLAGQLELLINPDSTNDTPSVYAPMAGDVFDLITIGPGPTEGDYTGDGIVDGSDFDVWVAAFGTTGSGLAADGNGDGIINAADYAVWRENLGDEGLVTGALSGSLSLSVVDPGNVLGLAGLTIQLNQTATSLQAVVVSAAAVAVPEPSSIVVCLLGVAALSGARGKRA